MDDGCEDGWAARHGDYLHPGLGLKGRIFIGEDVKLPAPGPDFLKVGLEFFEKLVVGRHGHHGHVLIHQGQGAVLELPGGVPFRVDIADFLEL
jgi:hypothetical protein